MAAKSSTDMNIVQAERKLLLETWRHAPPKQPGGYRTGARYNPRRGWTRIVAAPSLPPSPCQPCPWLWLSGGGGGGRPGALKGTGGKRAVEGEHKSGKIQRIFVSAARQTGILKQRGYAARREGSKRSGLASSAFFSVLYCRNVIASR